MSLPHSAQIALQAFSACQGWEQRARLLMQWGDQLAPLNDQERCETNRVQGCESQVWLLAEITGRTGSFAPAVMHGCCAACSRCCWHGSMV